METRCFIPGNVRIFKSYLDEIRTSKGLTAIITYTVFIVQIIILITTVL
jgi:hypothetical protein